MDKLVADLKQVMQLDRRCALVQRRCAMQCGGQQLHRLLPKCPRFVAVQYNVIVLMFVSHLDVLSTITEDGAGIAIVLTPSPRPMGDWGWG